ncbi:hypothetical protein PPERSA_12742 [Pseudocohnilembus persalinus]|uniref:Uncharacterized protein n=1 Tax=Pseudocohnilembus persalinus TaxID=266149 RepID=A0A0V0QTB4_PSEPJ|nr:hypothetical protein PPERSA_12742 [Pseudocohnilembus persalinus]|eukprot:KRX05564.1 hypothetical protein PPERSA_12742 [Pseudocohnilembus persalinus]
MEQFYSSNNKYLLLREKKYPFLKLVDTEQNFQITWSLQDIFEKQKFQRELEQIKLEKYDSFYIDTTQINKGDSIDIHEFEMEKIWGNNKISALERIFNIVAYISYFLGPLLQALDVSILNFLKLVIL